MHGKGLPVPDVQDANEALEMLDKLHQALEAAGGEAEVTIGTLIASGALGSMGEGALIVLGGVAQTAAAFYISAAISCLSFVAASDLRKLFADNSVPGFVVAELEDQGVDLAAEATA